MMNHDALTAIGLLTAAVTALWGVFMKKDREKDKRLDACETDRSDMNKRLHKLEIQQAVFYACGANPCPAKQALAAQREFDRLSALQNTHHENQTSTHSS